MTFDHDTGDILIAREDAIYTYGPGGRGPSFAFDSPKTSIHLFRDYISLVCPPNPAFSKSDAFRRFGSSQVDDLFNTSTFTLLDLDLRFIAHTESLSSTASHIFMEWGDLFLVTVDGKVSSTAPYVEILQWLIKDRSTAITKKRYSRNSRYYTREISISWR